MDMNLELILKEALLNQKTILDAGCGLGYKAAWFANLSPTSGSLYGFSDAIFDAAKRYENCRT